MKNIYYIAFLTLLLGMASCSSESDSLEVSPTFDNEFGEMVGVDQKVGVVGGPVNAGESQKWMWHFWGEENLNKDFSVVAINMETDEEIDPLQMHEVLMQRESDQIISNSRSQVLFPSEGIWKIETYIEDDYFEEFYVEVNPEGTEF